MGPRAGTEALKPELRKLSSQCARSAQFVCGFVAMADDMLARGDAVLFCVSEALLDIAHGNVDAVANALRQRIHILDFSLQPCGSSSSDSQMHFPFSVLSAGCQV